MGFCAFLRDVWEIKRTLAVILIPLVLIPLPLIAGSSEAKCAYGLIIVAIFWISEALPLAVTSLLPAFLFPVLGVMKSTDVSANYIKDSSLFLLGGMAVATAVERWNLHKRIALRVLLIVGTEPKWLLMGVMLPTWFLSIWMGNIAVTTMMVPTVVAVLQQLKETHQVQDMELGDVKLEDVGEIHEILLNGTDLKHNTNRMDWKEKVESRSSYSESNDYINTCKAMMLCVSYSANIGGTTALSGTIPNVICQGQADIVYQRAGMDSSGVNFMSWMVFALPGSVISIILTWVWLQIWFLGCR